MTPRLVGEPRALGLPGLEIQDECPTCSKTVVYDLALRPLTNFSPGPNSVLISCEDGHQIVSWNVTLTIDLASDQEILPRRGGRR